MWSNPLREETREIVTKNPFIFSFTFFIYRIFFALGPKLRLLQLVGGIEKNYLNVRFVQKLKLNYYRIDNKICETVLEQMMSHSKLGCDFELPAPSDSKVLCHEFSTELFLCARTNQLFLAGKTWETWAIVHG